MSHEGNDTLYGDDGDDLLLGYDGNDTLYGGAGNDDLRDMEGDDTIFGGDGNDIIYGGAGNDTYNGDNGVDTVYATSGLNTINGGAGGDLLYGGSDTDTINGGDDNDFVRGRDGDDILHGNAGNDDIIGGAGIDVLHGGDGDDRLVFDLSDTINGDAGFDAIYMNADDGASWRLSDINASSIEQIDLSNMGEGFENIFTLRLNEIDAINTTLTLYITGDIGMDTVIATQLNSNHLQGVVALGDRVLDHYSRWGYNVYIEQGLKDGSEQTSGLIGDETDNVLTGTTDADTIFGNGGNDTLDGQAGIDTLDGGAGNDILYYDTEDTILGQAGYDTLALRNGDATAVSLTQAMITGIDEVDLRNGASNTVTLNINDVDNISDGTSLYIFGENGQDSITVANMTDNHFQGYIELEGEVLAHYLRNGNSVYLQHGILNGGSTGDGFIGTNSGEIITGSLQGDVILSKGGDDTITYTAGDVIQAGDGTDTIILNAGDTTAVDRNDLSGVEIIDLTNSAANTISFSMSNILTFSGAGSLTVLGDVGVDTVTLSQLNHNNHLQGLIEYNGELLAHYNNQGADLYIEYGLGSFNNAPDGQGYVGTGGDDTFVGTAGDDAMLGNGGDDILYYDSGDVLYGGAGVDTMALKTGDALSLDSSSLRNDIDSIEALDMENGAANTIDLRMSHILDFGENDVFYITGDAGLDTVDARQLNTNNHFVQTVTVNGTVFDHYNNAGADLYVEQGITII